MKVYDSFIIFFGLKKRNAPQRENWVEYASANSKGHWLSDANLLLYFFIFISFYFPMFLTFVIFSIYYRTLSNFDAHFEANFHKTQEAQFLVHLIQVHHVQSLKEKFIFDPELIYTTHKKKSLLYWAKHYNNLEAHKMIIELMKEKTIQRKNIA